MQNGLVLKFSRKQWQLVKDGVLVATFVNANAGRSLAATTALDAAKLWMFDGIDIDGPKTEIDKLMRFWPGIPPSATDTFIPMR